MIDRLAELRATSDELRPPEAEHDRPAIDYRGSAPEPQLESRRRRWSSGSLGLASIMPSRSTGSSTPEVTSSSVAATTDAAQTAAPDDLQVFLDRLDVVQSGLLLELERLLVETKDLHGQALRAVVPASEQRLLEQVEANAKAFSVTANKIVRALQEFTADVVPTQTMLRVRQQSLAGTTRRFQKAVNTYFEEQKVFRNEMEAKVSRQLRAAFPEADSHEVATVAAGGRRSASIAINEALLTHQGGTGLLSAATAIDIARERCDELEELARAAAELNRAFMDVESLIVAQGEVIDDIEQHVQATRQQADEGVEALEGAQVQLTRLRRRHCCIIGVISTCIVLVLLFWYISQLH